MPVDPEMMISEFKGEYRFLSNFWSSHDTSVEHKFQAAKTVSREEAVWVLEAETPGEAKRRGRQVKIREDWDDVRVYVMSELVAQKFRNPVLLSKLLLTNPKILVEGNTWGDTFWGVDLRTGQGQNVLGTILMAVRAAQRVRF